ncbi:MAG: sugar ABC transporter substrate-binding protein [Eubacteriales bacterium]|nr:sugar ABC transporter substrate-binding protein [Eubacteriales bacterium]
MKKMLKRTIVLVITMLMVVALVGCASGTQDTQETQQEDSTSPSLSPSEETSSDTVDEPAEDLLIGYICIDFSNISFAEQSKYMKQRCDELGITLQMVDMKRDVNLLLQYIESFKSAGAGAIIFPAFDASVPTEVIKDAHDSGIFIMVQETPLSDTSVFDAWTGTEAVVTGRGIGQNAADWINATFDSDERVEVALCYNPGYPLSAGRMQGVREILEAQCPNAVIVAEENAVTVETGVEAGENFIQAYPNLNCVICATDNGGLGVLEAFNAGGKTGEDVGIFGCDMNAQAIVELRKPDSVFRGTIAQNMNRAGIEVIDACYAAMTGETYPERIPYDVTPITHDNIEQHLLENPEELPLD